MILDGMSRRHRHHLFFSATDRKAAIFLTWHCSAICHFSLCHSFLPLSVGEHTAVILRMQDDFWAVPKRILAIPRTGFPCPQCYLTFKIGYRFSRQLHHSQWVKPRGCGVFGWNFEHESHKDGDNVPEFMRLRRFRECRWRLQPHDEIQLRPIRKRRCVSIFHPILFLSFPS